MHSALAKLFNDRDTGLGGKLVAIYGGLIAANLLGWLWALIALLTSVGVRPWACSRPARARQPEPSS